MYMQAREFTHRERMTLAAICIAIFVCAIHSLRKTQKGHKSSEETPETERDMQRTVRNEKGTPTNEHPKGR